MTKHKFCRKGCEATVTSFGCLKQFSEGALRPSLPSEVYEKLMFFRK